MDNLNRIIDTTDDISYFTEVRNLLGITVDDLDDDVLKSDIILGMAERMVCKVFVPNWIDVLNGEDKFAIQALRSCIIIRVCLNILNMPVVQNILINEVRLIDVIVKTSVNIDKLKESLEKMFKEQLSIVGVSSSEDYPKLTAFELTDRVKLYDYKVNTFGNLEDA